MDKIIIHTDPKKTNALVEFLKEFEVSFELIRGKKVKEKPYDPDFVKKVLKARKDPGGKVLTPDYKKELLGD